MGSAATMIWNPEFIHYLCIARSQTILAQHQNGGSNDDSTTNIETLASECIAQTPPNHSLYTHTVKNRTYTFLIDPPYTYFAIFDHHLLKSHALNFLNRFRSSLRISLASSNDHFAPLSLQPQFDSILRETLIHMNAALSPNNSGKRSLPPPPAATVVPLIGKPPVEGGLKKKKRALDDAALLDLSSNDDVGSLSGSVKVAGAVNDHRQKAKHIWKKHVWVVLLLDLFVCAVLFVIWLWVCSGFKCMAY